MTGGNNALAAYFSCTGTTEGIAGLIAGQTGGALYEIVAEDPHTEEDLEYYTGGRADPDQEEFPPRDVCSRGGNFSFFAVL